MIKNLFFPDRIGNYFLFKKNFVGFHITKNTVYATCISAKGTTLTLTQSFCEPIESPEKVELSISKIIAKVKAYDSLITTIDSSLIMFKELTLPIIGEEKIAMVLGFELESYLPFPADQATIDFIVTKIDEKAKTSTVMVTAVQKKYVVDHIQLFSKINLHVNAVTVDLINIYGLYQKTKTTQSEGNIALIVLDDSKTHIAYLQNTHIRKIRTLDLSISDEQGFNKASFTINSFAQEEGPLKKIVLMGALPQGLLAKVKETFGVICEVFKVEKALQGGNITTSATQDVSQINILSLAAAYPSEIREDFNLEIQEASDTQKQQSYKQFITGAVLSLGILLSLSVHTFFQVRKLSVAADAAKEKLIKELKKNFTSLKGTSLREVVKNANKELQKEESIWFSFSSQTQHSFLKYMLEMSTKIDREVLGLNLKKMIINKNTITIDGNVRNFEAIEEFEKELKETKLFTEVPLLQQTSFSPLILPLANQGERS
jgi:Tfp pilus assembly PilM family ATPase